MTVDREQALAEIHQQQRNRRTQEDPQQRKVEEVQRQRFENKEYRAVQQHHEGGVFDEFFDPEPVDVRNSAVLHLVFAGQQVQQRRAAECDEQRGDRVDSGRSHENVHRDAHQQSERQQQQRRDLHRQQDDKGDVGQRMNVDADPDPAEQENLQQGHYHE